MALELRFVIMERAHASTRVDAARVKNVQIRTQHLCSAQRGQAQRRAAAQFDPAAQHDELDLATTKQGCSHYRGVCDDSEGHIWQRFRNIEIAGARVDEHDIPGESSAPLPPSALFLDAHARLRGRRQPHGPTVDFPAQPSSCQVAQVPPHSIFGVPHLQGQLRRERTSLQCNLGQNQAAALLDEQWCGWHWRVNQLILRKYTIIYELYKNVQNHATRETSWCDAQYFRRTIWFLSNKALKPFLFVCRELGTDS